ncbi:GH25 family lysozyme, partial [Lacticaseibacillus paracasei]
MKFKTKLITLVVAFLAAISFALPSQVNAANTDMVDTSNNNGLMTYDNYYDMLVHYGVKAVVQKVSEGTTYVDPTAKYNLASAKQAGLYLNG